MTNEFNIYFNASSISRAIRMLIIDTYGNIDKFCYEWGFDEEILERFLDAGEEHFNE